MYSRIRARRPWRTDMLLYGYVGSDEREQLCVRRRRDKEGRGAADPPEPRREAIANQGGAECLWRQATGCVGHRHGGVAAIAFDDDSACTAEALRSAERNGVYTASTRSERSRGSSAVSSTGTYTLSVTDSDRPLPFYPLLEAGAGVCAPV